MRKEIKLFYLAGVINETIHIKSSNMLTTITLIIVGNYVIT